jgi:hypothetical protein
MLVAKTFANYLASCRKLYGPDWPRRTQQDVGKTLEALGAIPGDYYPKYKLKALKRPRTPQRDKARSLAPVFLLELEGVRPADRDFEALKLVRTAALDIFRKAEELFSFGQGFGSSSIAPDGVDPAAWYSIKTLINSVNAEVQETGRATMRHDWKLANKRSTWVEAGLPAHIIDHAVIAPMKVHQLVVSCLAVTASTTVAVKIIFCCDTGWNQEQINELAAEPYAFRDDSEAGICDGAFLAAFKARANHFVHAYLERGYDSYNPTPAQIKMMWEDELKFRDGASATVVAADSSLLAILDRYKSMAEPLRSLDGSERFSEGFFICLTMVGLSQPNGSIHGDYSLGELLGRAGIGYTAIRQSFGTVIRRKTGSLTLTKLATDHTRTGVILRHYDDDTIRAEIDGAIRFFQNAIQSVVLKGRDVAALRLGLSNADSAWFEKLSVLSGITTAIGIRDRRNSVDEQDFLYFVPSLENLKEIYLLRRSLIAARFRLGNDRWRVQGLPLMAIVNALRRHCSESGFGGQYTKAVSLVLRDLRSGLISLPPVLEL